jgi:hypothetical protein
LPTIFKDTLVITVALLIAAAAVAILAIYEPWKQTAVHSEHPTSIAVSDIRTYWLLGVPSTDGGEICAPAVAFKLTNKLPRDIQSASFSASFLNETAKTVYGANTVEWLGDVGPLPPGYSRTVLIYSSAGVPVAPFACNTANIPADPLRVVVRASINDGDAAVVWQGGIAHDAMMFMGEGAEPVAIPSGVK